ncbi:MAG: Hsp20/alpha crystallin family protein [Rubrivivax sp.]|nr:Hsp20/alpha crystallin family protein [Rubrivivax sp.]
MASLIRWVPLGDLPSLNWSFDRFFREFMGPVEIVEEGDCAFPAVESFRHNGSFVVRVDLPGVNPKDVHLTADQGCLTIEGERKRAQEIPESSLIRDELCYGSFRRSLALPEGVKTEQIRANYHDGILEITAPMEEHHLPKKIEIEVQRG